MRVVSQQSAIARPTTGPAPPSSGLQWLWQLLRDVRQPHILDCGRVRQTTVDVLLRRGAKLYLADLVSPLQRCDPELWDRSRKAPVFRTDDFLSQVPEVPAGSLAAVFCWQLLDLLPRDALAQVVLELYLYLQPHGVLFCLLREPHLAKGSESVWWLESLTALGRDGAGSRSFPYPALSNREVERLIPRGSVKTFLTRSGWREVLAIK